MKINKIIKDFDEEFLNVIKISILKNGTVILHYKNKVNSFLHFKEIPNKYYEMQKLLKVKK